MTGRAGLIDILLRLYPSAWREQYGAELAHLLETQPLGVGTVMDVMHAALWQRVRAAEPSTILGVGCLLLMGAGVVVTPTGYGQTVTALIRPSHMTFPTIKVTFFESELFALLLVACGYWTQRRRSKGAATAAMRMTVIAGLPVIVGGVLIGLSAIQATFPVSSNPSQTMSPSAWPMILAPFLRAPESAIWGAVGGRIGRWHSSRVRPTATVM